MDETGGMTTPGTRILEACDRTDGRPAPLRRDGHGFACRTVARWSTCVTRVIPPEEGAR